MSPVGFEPTTVRLKDGWFWGGTHRGDGLYLELCPVVACQSEKRVERMTIGTTAAAFEKAHVTKM